MKAHMQLLIRNEHECILRPGHYNENMQEYIMFYTSHAEEHFHSIDVFWMGDYVTSHAVDIDYAPGSMLYLKFDVNGEINDTWTVKFKYEETVQVE